jgi:hypothetical protein
LHRGRAGITAIAIDGTGAIGRGLIIAAQNISVD